MYYVLFLLFLLSFFTLIPQKGVSTVYIYLVFDWDCTKKIIGYQKLRDLRISEISDLFSSM